MKLYPLLPHLRQERLPLRINKRHPGQIHQQMVLLRTSGFAPAAIQFLHPGPGQSAFECKSRGSRLWMDGDFQHFRFSFTFLLWQRPFHSNDGSMVV